MVVLDDTINEVPCYNLYYMELRQVTIMLRLNRYGLKYTILLFFMLFFFTGSFLFGQKIEETAGASTMSETQADTPEEVLQVTLVPFIAQGAPLYTSMLMDRLVQQNFDRTAVLKSKVLAKKDSPTGGELPSDIPEKVIVQSLVKIGKKDGSRYVAAGSIGKEGSQYRIKMIIVDVEKESRILSSEKVAVGLEDVDRVVRDITDELIENEFPASVREKVQELRKADALENAKMRDDLASLEKLAEENPEEAIKKLPETVQRAVTEKAREEVVQEEIQQLYETEKEEKRIARNRKWQKYGMFTAYGLRFGSDMIQDAAIQSNMRALRYWSLYMNDYLENDPYDEYRHFQQTANSMGIASTINGSLGSGGLAYSYLFLRDDVLEIRAGGRKWLAIANSMYVAGRAASQASGGFGYYSMDLFDRYMGEYSSPDKITERYKDYRNAHDLYEIGRYTALSLQLAGAAGIAATYFWPGEREMLVLSERAGTMLGISNICTGAGTILGQAALNMYLQGIEASIKARSPSGNPDADPEVMYNTYAVTLGMGALALYTASAVISARTLVKAPVDSTKADRTARRDERALPFQLAVAPAPAGGVTLAFEVER
jgi:TolB-like protein